MVVNDQTILMRCIRSSELKKLLKPGYQLLKCLFIDGLAGFYRVKKNFINTFGK